MRKKLWNLPAKMNLRYFEVGYSGHGGLRENAPPKGVTLLGVGFVEVDMALLEEV